jgi:hypothetical protein
MCCLRKGEEQEKEKTSNQLLNLNAHWLNFITTVETYCLINELFQNENMEKSAQKG